MTYCFHIDVLSSSRVEEKTILILAHSALCTRFASFPTLAKIEGVFGLHHSFPEWEEQGVGGDVRKGFEDVEREVEEKGLKLSITDGGKEQGDHILYVTGEVSGMQQERSCVENKNQAVGSEGEGEKKKCDVRFSLITKKSGLPEKLHDEWCAEVVEDGAPLASAWRGQAVGHKAEVEEADGSSSRQEGVGVAPAFHGSE